jgi:hypothetical protein
MSMRAPWRALGPRGKFPGAHIDGRLAASAGPRGERSCRLYAGHIDAPLVVSAGAGALWEQLLARTHRPGQQASCVEVDVFQHTADYVGAFAMARERARFIEQTDGQPQKLLMARYEWL